MNPDVTVIVGCYKQESWLAGAIDSVSKQQFSGKLEVIINHDNCDSTGTGAAAARNRAIKQATGTYVICLDADDRLPTNYIGTLMNRLGYVGNFRKAFAGCPVQFISGSQLIRVQPSNHSTVFPTIDIDSISSTPAASMFPKRAWEEVGGYDESLVWFEDWDFWVRLRKAGYLYLVSYATELIKNNDGITSCKRVSSADKQTGIDYMKQKHGLIVPNYEIIL
jgi:glycosyltransferase involved in cell wall biosynthesis